MAGNTLSAYRIEWSCVPPRLGQTYVVLEEEWNEDFTVRTIRAWQPTDDTECLHDGGHQVVDGVRLGFYKSHGYGGPCELVDIWATPDHPERQKPPAEP